MELMGNFAARWIESTEAQRELRHPLVRCEAQREGEAPAEPLTLRVKTQLPALAMT